jgi:hypothetical protein
MRSTTALMMRITHRMLWLFSAMFLPLSLG